MNKLKVYCAVILYLATNSVYAVRGVESAFSHVLGPLSTMMCGLTEPPKSELENFLKIADEMDCSSKVDIQDHCACIGKISDRPLSLPSKNKILAEIGFLTNDMDASRTKLLNDLSQYNMALGAYGDNIDNSVMFGPTTTMKSCIDDEDIKLIEDELKDNFTKSADTKVGVPALYRKDFLDEVKDNNRIKFMDFNSKNSDAKLVEDIAKFIAKKEKAAPASPLLNIPSTKFDSSFWVKSEEKAIDDYSEGTFSTVEDSDRAALVLEFLSEPENNFLYAGSPLFRIYNQTYDRSKTDISDYLGRLASRSGLIDDFKSNTPVSSDSFSKIEIATKNMPVSMFLSGECLRLKEEIKKNASSSYIPRDPFDEKSNKNFNMTMNFEDMMKAQTSGRFFMSEFENLDPSTNEGLKNIEALKRYREKFKKRYGQSLGSLSSEEAAFKLKEKDFNFSQLICSNIEIEKEVDLLVTEIQNGEKSEEILESIIKTKEGIDANEQSIDNLRRTDAAISNEKVTLVSDNAALEERLKDQEVKLESISNKRGRVGASSRTAVRRNITNIKTSIGRNNERIEEIDNKRKEITENKNTYTSRNEELTSNLKIPKKRPVVSVQMEPSGLIPMVKEVETDDLIKKSLLDREIGSFVVESSGGENKPVEKMLFTGEKTQPKDKLLTQNIDTGEFDFKSSDEVTKEVLDADANRVSTQVMAFVDNKVSKEGETAKAMTSIVETQSKKVIEVIENKKEEIDKEGVVVGNPELDEALERSVKSGLAAEVVLGDTLSDKDELLEKGLGDVQKTGVAHAGFQSGQSLTRFVADNSEKFQNAAFAGLGGLVGGSSTGIEQAKKILNNTGNKPIEVAKNLTKKGSQFIENFTTGGILPDDIGGIDDLDKFGEGLAEATLRKLEERGIDASGLSPPTIVPNSFPDKVSEKNQLIERSKKIKREIASKRSQLKGLQIGNIGLGKNSLGEKNTLDRAKDYASSNLPAQSFNPQIAKEKAGVVNPPKTKTDPRLGQKDKTDKVTEKLTPGEIGKELGKGKLAGTGNETKALAQKIKSELKKTKAVVSPKSRKVSKGASSSSTSGGSLSSGGGSSASSGSSGGAPSSVASNNSIKQRSPSSVETSKKVTQIKFESSLLALNKNSYEVSPVLDAVESELYIRLPNFDTPEDFLNFTAEKKNEWIEKQFTSSKAFEAILVLPGGEKVLVKKKN